MVLKLIKHDFVESSRKFVPVIGMIVAVTAMIIIMFKSSISGWGAEVVVIAMSFMVFGLSIASFVLSVMGIIDLLYTSVYNKRGYQLFTMPVKSWEILLSKLALVFIWVGIISIVTILCAGFIFLMVFGNVGIWEYVTSFFNYIANSLDIRVYLVSMLSNLVSTVYSFALFMFVGSVIHSSYVQNGRNYKMLIFYLIASVVMSSMFGLLMTSDVAIDFFLQDALVLGEVIDPLLGGWEQLFTLAVNVDVLQATLWFALLKALIAGLFAFGTLWFWKNKLEIVD